MKNKSIPHYTAKMNYLYTRQSGKCAGCGKSLDMWFNDPQSFQHRLHKTKHAIEAFPLFIDSIFNGLNIHRSCNTTKHRGCGGIVWQKAERWERFLQRHPRIAEWGNNPRGNLWQN